MTKVGARGFLQACFAMAALLLFAVAGLRAETLDQLYEKAKLDKASVFYAGGPAAPHENRAKEFMQKYPAIAVSVMGGLNEQLEKQMADRKRRPRWSRCCASFRGCWLRRSSRTADLKRRMRQWT